MSGAPVRVIANTERDSGNTFDQFDRTAQKVPTVLLMLFIFSLVLPINIYLGAIRLSPYRIIVLLMFIPAAVQLFSGLVGKVRATDWFMMLFAAWASLGLFLHLPLERAIEAVGIFTAESLGAYLLGRTLIRNEKSFRIMVRAIFILLIVLFPFAIYESLSGRAILLELLRPFFSVPPQGMQSPRFGLRRAQVLFEHPIIYGTFAASILGLVSYVFSKRRFQVNIPGAGFVSIAAVLSVSSSTIAAIFVQIIFVAWDIFTKTIKSRWWVLFILILILYFIIDLLSSRSPFHVIVSYLTFSQGSSYNRILIWQYGSAEVWRHPVFGIGFEEWERPSWMSGSMDNMWLVMAVRHGIPAFLLLALAFGSMLLAVGRASLGTVSLQNCRTGLLVSLGGMMVTAGITHYWNAIYVWFLFLLGSGIWMLQENQSGNTVPEEGDLESDGGVKSAIAPVNDHLTGNPYARRRSE